MKIKSYHEIDTSLRRSFFFSVTGDSNFTKCYISSTPSHPTLLPLFFFFFYFLFPSFSFLSDCTSTVT